MFDNHQEKYINPYTDFGFKKLFGTEMNKDLLISFLNAILGNGDLGIRDVSYLNGEHLGDGYGDRRAVFDVYCETETGAKFIVEMQKGEQRFFKDRSIYYATTPIREQAPKGKWDYRLQDVYSVGVLDFVFPNGEYPEDSYRHEIKLKDVEDNHVFYDKLTFIYLEMPKFTKMEDELETMADKWMYAVRNLSRLLDRPKALQDRVFMKFFEQAEIARYSEKERRDYEESVKIYRDYINTVDTAHQRGYEIGLQKGFEEGRAEGIEKGRAEGIEKGRAEGIEKGRAEGIEKGRAEGIHLANLEQASKMKSDGLPIEVIVKYTGLTEAEIAAL